MATIDAYPATGPAVREPTAEQLEYLTDLTSLFAWAGLPGDPEYAASPAGSLMMIVGGGELPTIEEFANVSPALLERDLLGWKYSPFHTWEAANDAGYADHPPPLDIVPPSLMIGRAAAAHHAARLHCKIEYSREATAQYEQ